MAQRKKKLTEKRIRESLVKQLERRGMNAEFYEDLINDYVHYWNLKKDLLADIKDKGLAMERTQGEIKVGWGKYYGPMVEHGTKKMTARAHLKPLFEQNKEKYYRKMTEQIFS